MQRDHRRSRHSSRHPLARWGWTAALAVLCVILAACGGAAARQSPTPISASSTPPSANRGYQPTAPATPYAPAPPYAFAGAWADAPGLGQLNTANPTAYAFAPTDGRAGYLCSGADGHLYATQNSGASWQALRLNTTTGCAGVFIDAHDASDVFVETASAAQSAGVPDGYDLWRSRDAGASWSKLAAVPVSGMRLVWSQMAVVGSRLIGGVQVDQEGYLQNGLFASSDGGLTWQHFAQSVANQGYTIGAFTLIGSAIYIATTQGTNPGGMEPRLWADRGGAQSSAHTSAAPLSGQPTAQVFWRSLDGGATWGRVTLPGQNAVYGQDLYAMGKYALAEYLTDISSNSPNPLYDAQMWWSADSGATWKRLPDMSGLESGYVIAGGFGALAPDGSVIAAAQHDPASYGDDAGIFRIQPGATSPAWSPLVAGGVQDWQTSQTSAGLRLWGIGSNESDTHLKYVDVAG